MARSRSDDWNGKSRGGSFGYLCFIWLIRYLGVRFAYLFLIPVAAYFIPFAPKATSAAWRYHRRIRGLGVCRSSVELYRHFYRFGQTLIDRIAVSGGLSHRYRFEFENYEEFLRILDAGSGAVLIGAHVGCWEIGSKFFGEYASRINVVMYDAEYESIKKTLNRHKAPLRYQVIAIDKDALAGVLRIKGALDRGEYVCFQGDRYTDVDHTYRRTFLGQEAHFPAGPFRVASRLKVPVVFYYAVRERGRRYRFLFTPVESLPRTKGSDPAERLLDLYLASLERVVKEHPLQWFNFYSFWS